jgi:sialidase-1
MAVSRRTMLQWTGAIAAGAFVGTRCTPARAEPPRAVVESLDVISAQPELYCGWPTLARRKSGELLVTYSGGRENHVCPFGRVEMIQSHDDGRSWTWPRVLLDGAIDDRDSGVLETAKGTLLVTTFTSLAYAHVLNTAGPTTEGKPPYPDWLRVHRRLTEEQRKNELGTWMIRSTDGGVTWSARYDCLVNSPHGPIALADGRLLYPGKQLWTQEKRNGVCESTDDGQSWRWLSDVPTREGDNPIEYHEVHAVEAPSGKIVLHIRNHNKANARETLQCESTDGGKTWSQPHPIGVWGLPSHLLRLKDGRLLMSYGHRRAPFGNQVRLSADEGATWSEPASLSTDGLGGDLGYPSTVELTDGSLLSVWYEVLKGSPRAVLRQARWRLA